MKNLMLAAAFVAFGTITASAQTTPQKKMDTTRSDTTRNNGNMETGNMNNPNGTTNNDWDKSKTDTANWKNKDGMKTERKMKKKK
ncbi:hypothetical protein [uncultured Chryseobacterium sp.]|uniref:hypothetical protein n=1 Tax=uncultured Chryseobacterium sp. TaxID=259322 RepID=UPI0025D3E19A|nr:hypothetical protein [uncultured Chryseobacterium sp.]